jgi:hypothetical protein
MSDSKLELVVGKSNDGALDSTMDDVRSTGSDLRVSERSCRSAPCYGDVVRLS